MPITGALTNGRSGKQAPTPPAEILKPFVHLQDFGVTTLYYGRHRKPKAEELGAKFEPDLDKFLSACDVITINCPLTDKTRCCHVTSFTVLWWTSWVL